MNEHEDVLGKGYLSLNLLLKNGRGVGKKVVIYDRNDKVLGEVNMKLNYDRVETKFVPPKKYIEI